MKKKTPDRSAILVTGGAGYIGSKLIRDLAEDPRFRGRTIRIYDSLRRQHFCGLMDLPAKARFEFIEGDVLDRISLQQAMKGVDSVLHLAAIVTTPMSFDHPEWTAQVNHWGTASVVECALAAEVGYFVHASSASVYGPGGPFTETSPCHPIGPYATSKLQAEKEVLQATLRGLKACILRIGTTFGNAPAMRFDAVASRLAYLAGIGRPLVIHGSGDQRRPLIHIRDVSQALRCCLARREPSPAILNATTMNPSVTEIATILQELVPGARTHYTDQDLLTEISFQVDSSLLMSLGFKPQMDLRKGMKEILARWHGFKRTTN